MSVCPMCGSQVQFQHKQADLIVKAKRIVQDIYINGKTVHQDFEVPEKVISKGCSYHECINGNCGSFGSTFSDHDVLTTQEFREAQ